MSNVERIMKEGRKIMKINDEYIEDEDLLEIKFPTSVPICSRKYVSI